VIVFGLSRITAAKKINCAEVVAIIIACCVFLSQGSIGAFGKIEIQKKT
jgi:hypothetical protein